MVGNHLRQIVCALLFSSPALAQDLPGAAELDTARAAFDVPGLAMVALEACEPGDVITSGLADLLAGVPVTANTAFEAASLTKPVFAYLVMTLVAEGVIDLDEPLADTFDYARIPDDAAYAQITTRMILTHRTGLPNWVDQATDFHDRTAPIPFEHAPGTTFSYSGEAFQLLQAFVEQKSGASVQALFAARLGEVMPHSTLVRPVPETVTASRGYQSASTGGPGRGFDNLYDRAMVASSLVTTADDYARFLSHICKGGDLPDDLYAEMLRPQSEIGAETATLYPPGTAWALGWMMMDMAGDVMAGHGGNNDEFNAFAGFMRQSGDGIVLLTNSVTGQDLIVGLLAP